MAYSRRELQWQIGDQINFKVESGLFEGAFTSEVVGLNPLQDIIQIKFPQNKGKLVLIPVGTIVVLETGDSEHACNRYSVIDRTSGANRCMVLQLVNSADNRLANLDFGEDTKVISVTSGKGGVGKTTVAINLAFAFAEQSQRVCIFDAALGTGNVDILLDLSPRFNLGHVITERCSLLETLVEVNDNVHILPGCSGVQLLTDLTDYEYNILAAEIKSISSYFDIFIIDTGSGITANVTNFVSAAAGGLLLTTPEPHSITDTYALLKTLISHQVRPLRLNLVVNRVSNRLEAEDTAAKLQFAASKFLGFELDYGGYIMEDPRIREANMVQKPIISLEPESPVSHSLRAIADYYLSPQAETEKLDNKGLMAKLRRIGRKV